MGGPQPMTRIERLISATAGTTWKNGSLSARVCALNGDAWLELRDGAEPGGGGQSGIKEMTVDQAKSLAEWILSLTREE